MEPKDQVLEVWGDFACFSRPEMKVERFSYPVITPSAARGIFDAIFSKPNKNPTQAQFRWQITKIEILNPIKFISLRRNEVKEKASVKPGWLSGKDSPEPIWADGSRDLLGTDTKGRTQRQTMALKNVHYRLHAQIRPWNHFQERLPGLEAQFERRAANGKCFYQPYFGCREFPAFFALASPEAGQEKAIPVDMDLGFMLYDVFDLSRQGSSEDQPRISLFRASVKQGVLMIPEYHSEQVLKG